MWTWRWLPPVGAAVTSQRRRRRLALCLRRVLCSLKLSSYKGKWVVLFFYPKDFTFVCPTEIIAFSDRSDEFRKIGCEVVAASCDTPEVHLAWIRWVVSPRVSCPAASPALWRAVTGTVVAANLIWPYDGCSTTRKNGGLGLMRIPIVSDPTRSISNDYGVLLDEGIPLRGLFVIDPEGVVQQATVNNLPVGRSVDEALRLVQGYQYVAKHGEVRPCARRGWRCVPPPSAALYRSVCAAFDGVAVVNGCRVARCVDCAMRCCRYALRAGLRDRRR